MLYGLRIRGFDDLTSHLYVAEKLSHKLKLDEEILCRKRKYYLFREVFCAHEKIRTSTTVRSPPPQDGVSTNSTTCA